ncbi:MAG: bifunctional glutamate N-acetyltransferase/amino-acid acetyltransferase ArgJ [Gammaproteobacteria bacterium]|jgi:glutamate N-acetyltransferase/amino-acid N-acetyltransferase|nr:bifunctional glutamate N-acetyltransferase/amino-acid acetyltransferase ArgJ [Gammaproteobacteria bacterium]
MAVGAEQTINYFPIAGFKLGTTSAGIKTAGRKDLVIMQAQAGSTMAGVFTANAFCAAPVHICRQHLASHKPLLMVVNTGNANAGTGAQGMLDAEATCAAVAKLASVSKAQVLPFSTGVIGEHLPMDCLLDALPQAFTKLTEYGWSDAAEGILTTDTRTKGASVKVNLSGQDITISGIAKGSGMIRPNMATMLAFVATDVALSPELTQNLVREAAELSFNRITVDGDMSTNDSCMLVATGASGKALHTNTDDYHVFRGALISLMQELAQAIVRDGEGASKFIAIEVQGGQNRQECLNVAYAIAHSPLVKTALFAADPNWGRILAAVGYAGVHDLDVNLLTIHLGDVLLVANGGRAASYTEAAGQAVMDLEEINIRVDLQRGTYQETVWTTDLTYEYVRINADYRS